MNKISTVVLFALLAFASVTCGTVSFNMSGASIGNAKTCHVAFFENRADIVIPSLSAQVTDALKDKIQSSSSLRLVNSNADVTFEGEITGFNIQPQQIAQDGRPQEDRLTVTVKVKFTNMLDEDKNYDKSFSRFRQASTGSITGSGRDQLVEFILEELMEDIYNEAFASW